MSATISVIVIAKNEAEMIANCLESLQWCDEIIVIDNESSDATAELAKRSGARVITSTAATFSEIRNKGLQTAKTDWVLYIDADERVTPKLASEITQAIMKSEATAYSLTRRNILYGHEMQHGGWQNDEVVRLFKREAIITWHGEVHEHAEVSGQQLKLSTPLWHLTHRNIVSGLLKTAEWTPVEAKLLYEANVPAVTLFTLLRKGGMSVWRHAVRKQGYKDGVAGWVEALVQGMNRMLVYMQVWEMQQKPTLDERYTQLEEVIAKEWQRQP
ncbi:MAG: glycosyltransferase family 2 protein [bacterium]|nr:glycosyltransferase family 2 protein [bacterium]